MTAMRLSRRLRLARHQLHVAIEAFRIPQAAVPGHYYSAIPSIRDIRRHESEIFPTPPPDSLPGIELNTSEQLALVKELSGYYADQPFSEGPRPDLRYHFANSFFSYGDGLMLYSMLRHIAPSRIIEVGSGFSSAVILDTNERFLDGRAQCTFIEPYADRLKGLLRDSDRSTCRVIERPVQEVDLAVFDQLEDGDVLFIDSSHLVKVGSDVARIFTTILPSVPTGVYIHIHDIPYPFQYPRSWIYQGRFLNEAYVLHAFLQFNREFKILLFNSYLEQKHAASVTELMPLWARNPGGSVWLRRVAA